MHSKTLGFVGAVLAVSASSALGQVQMFINDFDGWAAATGTFSTIDFDTLPDGSPSDSSVEINSLLNYTNQGATFSTPFDGLIIVGNEDKGFGLRTLTVGILENPIFIQADLTGPTFSAGFTFGGNATLEAFDSDDNLLASAFFGSTGVGFFLGLTSEVPIAYLRMDESILGSRVEDFHFSSVPEPMTATLLALGSLAQLRRRQRAGNRSPSPPPYCDL